MQFPAIKLGVLAFFMFGIWSFFTDGFFLVLFPFIKDFTFVIVLVSFFQVKFEWTQVWALVLFTVFGLLSSQLIWESVMSNEQLFAFAESGWFDLLKLLFHIAAIIWLIVLALKFSQYRNLILLGLFTYLFLFILGNFIVPRFNLVFESVAWIVLGGLGVYVLRDEQTNNAGNFQFQLLVGIGLMHLLSLISFQLQF